MSLFTRSKGTAQMMCAAVWVRPSVVRTEVASMRSTPSPRARRPPARARRSGDAGVEIAQGDARDADVGGFGRGEEAFLEDVHGAGGGDTFDIEVARTDDDGGPEAADGALGLAGGGQEVVEGAVVPAGAVFSQHAQAAAADGELLGVREERGLEHGAGEVRGGGEAAAADGAGTPPHHPHHPRPPRFHPELLAVPIDVVIGVQAGKEVLVVGAAAEHDVLAVVERAPGADIDETGGAAAELLAGFEEQDAFAGLGESHGGGDAGEAGADNDHVLLAHHRCNLARRLAVMAMEALRTAGTRARPPCSTTRVGSRSICSRMPE